MRWFKNGLVAVVLAAMFSSVVATAADETNPKPKKTEGEKGQITGVVVNIIKQQVTIKSDDTSLDTSLTVWPYYRQDQKGFDKETMAKIGKLKNGDRVTVKWTFKEHYRIDSIEKVE